MSYTLLPNTTHMFTYIRVCILLVLRAADSVLLLVVVGIVEILGIDQTFSIEIQVLEHWKKMKDAFLINKLQLRA